MVIKPTKFREIKSKSLINGGFIPRPSLLKIRMNVMEDMRPLYGRLSASFLVSGAERCVATPNLPFSLGRLANRSSTGGSYQKAEH